VPAAPVLPVGGWVVSFVLTGTVSGIPQAVAVFAQVKRQTDTAIVQGMGRGIKRGEGIVKGKASGRPGPRVITGDFRRSIVGDFEASGDGALGQIGSNAAQAARLELGFVGTDVLGRRYNQPPYPYLGPSVPEVEAAVIEEITIAIQGIGWAA